MNRWMKKTSTVFRRHVFIFSGECKYGAWVNDHDIVGDMFYLAWIVGSKVGFKHVNSDGTEIKVMASFELDPNDMPKYDQPYMLVDFRWSPYRTGNRGSFQMALESVESP